MLEEQITNFEQKQTGWLEPMKKWIKETENLPKIAQESNLFAKKVACRTLFGSNLVLTNREARLCAPSGEENKLKISGGHFVPPTKWRQKNQKVLFWCRGAESNRRRKDFQSFALPTELPRQKSNNSFGSSLF